MAAPQRRYRSTLPTQPAWPAWEQAPAKKRAGDEKRRARGRKRRFAILVVIPVLVMLGSIYLHTVSSGVEARVAGLAQELDTARAEGERLEVDVAKLSAADRVRPLARDKLGMRDAGSADLEVVESGRREDGNLHAGAEEGGGQH